MFKFIAKASCAYLSLAFLSQAESDKIDIPSLEDSLPKIHLDLGEPKLTTKSDGIKIDLETTNTAARDHTEAGLMHLLGGWETEASRHFCKAIQLDPECLMPHWGLALATMDQSLETDRFHKNTNLRLITLLENGKGSELERGLAYAHAKQVNEGYQAGAELYRKVARKFPENAFVQIISTIINRGGYNTLGEATPDQELAETALTEIFQAQRNFHSLLYSLLLIRSEAEDLTRSLPLARKLTRLAPDYAPYFHLLGHYEWRCGAHQRAAIAFGRAASLYSDWMKQTGASIADCPDWVRSEAYRVVALSSKGETANAMASASKIIAVNLDHTRPSAVGTKKLLWHGKTATASLLLRQSKPSNLSKALQSLPSPAESENFRKTSLAYWWIDGLRLVLDARIQLESGNIKHAKELLLAINFHGQQMAAQQKKAIRLNEFSNWQQGKVDLEILALDLQGRIANTESGSKRRSAFNWFRAAADRQDRIAYLEAPRILTPMLLNLGDYLKATDRIAEADAVYKEALEKFPNDAEILKRVGK